MPASAAFRFCTVLADIMSKRSGCAVPPSSVTRYYSDTDRWKANALDFHDQVLQEVERLIRAAEAATATKASDTVRLAKIPHGNRYKMTPESFLEKAQQTVMLLKRIPGPAILQPRPMCHVPSAQLNQKPIAQYQSYGVPVSTRHQAHGNAIPLCYPNDMEWDQQRKRLENVERTSLILNPHALEILRSIHGPVCVIAIVGPCRTGKSYMLSRLISSTGVSAHFDLGHEMDPKTMGIWMWDQPFKMKLKNYHEEVTIILLDTEGIDAANATDQGDSQIFTLSVLLSSLMIYNSMSVPKREDLNHMDFVANLSKSIQVQAGKSAVGKEGMKVADSNPRFMWLLRDVILQPTDKNGKPCHIKDYLLQKVLVEDAKDDEAQKRIRECILSFFCAFDAEILPPPSTDPHVMQNIENPLYQKCINSEFLQKVEDVRKRIFNNCAPKKGFSGGSVVSGFQLAHMAELYVDALNSPGGIPVIGSTWQRVLEATYTDGMESAVKIYEKVMKKAAHDQLLPMESEQLLGYHRMGVEEALKKFEKATKLDSGREIYEAYLDKMMAQIAVYTEDGGCSGGQLAFYLEKNYGASKSACQALIDSLKQKHLDPLIKKLTPETDFRTIESAFMTLISLYNERCIGPASDDVLNRFVQDQEKQCQQLENQLLTIKHYNGEAKQRMKEVMHERHRFEQKETELKLRMEQSQQDQKAKLQAMSVKFARDAEYMQQEYIEQMQAQEWRLQNMAGAKLESEREHSRQMCQLRATLEERVSELQQHNAWARAEIQEEERRLRRRLQASQSSHNDGCNIL